MASLFIQTVVLLLCWHAPQFSEKPACRAGHRAERSRLTRPEPGSASRWISLQAPEAGGDRFCAQSLLNRKPTSMSPQATPARPPGWLPMTLPTHRARETGGWLSAVLQGLGREERKTPSSFVEVAFERGTEAGMVAHSEA